MENVALKGTVVLDETSVQFLKDKLRKEILEEIKNDGLEYDEISNSLKDFKYRSYFNMIRDTIEYAIKDGKKAEDEKDMHFDDEKVFRVLKVIESIIDISGLNR